MELHEALDPSIDLSHRSLQDGASISEIKVPTIDDFQLIKPISKGAFGKVFLGCKKGRPEKVFAIKVMKKSDMVNKNLKHQVITERDAMARSESPFVVQLYYSIQTHRNIFLVMEYLIGGDVKSLLTVCGFFDEPMAIMYIAEVTLALEYLHNQGIIHRDLKPDNMLITAGGHIKLTDFGLSKFSMSFNAGGQEMPMTPKTPLPYSFLSSDYYRTPGQILSLRSNLAFSTGKFGLPHNSPFEMTPEISRSSRLTGDATNIKASGSAGSHLAASPITPRLQSGKGFPKHMSMREKLLTKSTSKYVHESSVLSSSENVTPSLSTTPGRAPVKRLMSTMQDSLNWTESTDAGQTTEHSSVNISELSSVPRACGPIGMSLSCLDSPQCNQRESIVFAEKSSNLYTDASSQGSELSDNVFELTDDLADTSEQMDVSLTECRTDEGKRMNDCNTSHCGCSNAVGMESACECKSHLKAPSRQEKITDDTPQMHRTEESVWNSYAAKNLRSLRQGSYSEDSEETELVGNKENIRNVFNDPSIGRCSSENFRKRCDLKSKAKPRRLMKTKSFCYPSDDESDDYEVNRYRDRSIARKRSFCHVEISPVRRTQSADSGLTQEFRFLRFGNGEPYSKRSHSIPRTRIRFHSGNERSKLATCKSVAGPSDSSSKPTECLSKMMDGLKNLSDSDKLTSLSADEPRQEGHSDTSPSEHDRNTNTELTSVDDTGTSAGFETACSETKVAEESKFSFNNVAANESLIGGSSNIFPLCNKHLAHLKKPMVSSLASEGDIDRRSPNLSEIDRRSPNLSSVHEVDSPAASDTSAELDLDSSVFDSKEDAATVGDMQQGQLQEEKGDQHSTPPVPTTRTLLPPPPPRSRRKSGKPVPPSLKFASAAHYIEPRSRHSSGSSDAAMTPKTPLRQKVGFLTPNMKCPATPRTPLQVFPGRSQSLCQALKTPYRTPKSVRRAPAPDPDEERILGTPDYLAPEILQQQRHGPAVDWWALGICMFEFLTGVPPFNDQTPNLVFNNILNRDIPWPEGEEAISEESWQAIDKLLTMDPQSRPGGRQVRKMGVFKDVDWHNLLDATPTFIPEPVDVMDTTYFAARNDLLNLFVSDVDF